jgi:hypothetical protein
MDGKESGDERAINALKRAVSSDLAKAEQRRYLRAAPDVDSPPRESGQWPHARVQGKSIPGLILAAGIAIILGVFSVWRGLTPLPLPAPTQSDYDTEIRILIDEIHIDNPSRFELADIE